MLKGRYNKDFVEDITLKLDALINPSAHKPKQTHLRKYIISILSFVNIGNKITLHNIHLFLPYLCCLISRIWYYS